MSSPDDDTSPNGVLQFVEHGPVSAQLFEILPVKGAEETMREVRLLLSADDARKLRPLMFQWAEFTARLGKVKEG